MYIYIYYYICICNIIIYKVCIIYRPLKLEATCEYFIWMSTCQYQLVPRLCQAGMEGSENHHTRNNLSTPWFSAGIPVLCCLILVA